MKGVFLYWLILFLTGMSLLVGTVAVSARESIADSASYHTPYPQDAFYDSLKQVASQKRITRLLFDYLVVTPRPNVDKRALSLQYYRRMEDKIISDIKIQPLEVFGPTFEDTTRTARSWLERGANSVHTKSNLKTIRKLLLFSVGDAVNPELLYENERIIRALPYIQDVRILLEQDSVYSGFVSVLVLTKDRFSIGLSGGVEGSSSAALELYNQNIFGVGHEISVGFVGHLNRQPYAGLETYYKISNIRGKFIDLSAGYLNTFRNEGFSFNLEKPFITPFIPWGYGLSARRMYRSDRISANDPIESEVPLDLSHFRIWGGKSFQINTHQQPSQLVITAGISDFRFFQKPYDTYFKNLYYANRTIGLAGLTFSRQKYLQDHLVYGYGIIEDIPAGHKYEAVYGYDMNEFGNRHYLHIYLSNGSILPSSLGYLFLAGSIGGYIKKHAFEQGLIQGDLNYITPMGTLGKNRTRLFVKTNYLIGIRRHEVETLTLNRDGHIRGFSSSMANGKQRLSMNLEYVLFLNHELYKFRMAPYVFTDLGIIGTNHRAVFRENYYGGVGLGMRIHNENLVFKTIHLRLGFYPNAPSDMNFFGFILEEQLKKNFYNFRPQSPHALYFQ